METEQYKLEMELAKNQFGHFCTLQAARGPASAGALALYTMTKSTLKVTEQFHNYITFCIKSVAKNSVCYKRGHVRFTYRCVWHQNTQYWWWQRAAIAGLDRSEIMLARDLNQRPLTFKQPNIQVFDQKVFRWWSLNIFSSMIESQNSVIDNLNNKIQFWNFLRFLSKNILGHNIQITKSISL